MKIHRKVEGVIVRPSFREWAPRRPKMTLGECKDVTYDGYEVVSDKERLEMIPFII